MLIFVAWRSEDPTRPEYGTQQVSDRLADLFEPLVGERPQPERFDCPAGRAVWIELPTEGWHMPAVERAGGALAVAPDPPMNLHRLLQDAGAGAGPEQGPLLGLAQALERSPKRCSKS